MKTPAIFISTLLLFLVSYQNSSAYTKEQYAAVREDAKGCRSIPDSNEQSACERASEDVEKYCKSKDYPKTCPEEKWAESQKNSFENQKGQLSGTPDSNPNKERMKQQLDRKEREIREEKEEILTARANWKRCIAAREEVIRLFDEAIKTAKSDGDRDPSLGTYVGRLHVDWQTEQGFHADPLEQSKNGLRKCDNVLRFYP